MEFSMILPRPSLPWSCESYNLADIFTLSPIGIFRTQTVDDVFSGVSHFQVQCGDVSINLVN